MAFLFPEQEKEVPFLVRTLCLVIVTEPDICYNELSFLKVKTGKYRYSQAHALARAGRESVNSDMGDMQGSRRSLTDFVRKWMPPVYSWIPLCAVVAFNFTVYAGVRFINRNRAHYILSVPADELIPLWTPFVVIYLLAFVQWVLGYYLAARESSEVCWHVAAGDIIAKVITCLIFLAVPTTLHRPEITGSGFFDWVTRIVYAVDAPDNLLPSIHCLESWVCFRSSLWLKHAPRWYKWGSFVFTLLVFASTVFLKQHLLLDIPTGALLAEFGLWIAGWSGCGKIFGKINSHVRLPRI